VTISIAMIAAVARNGVIGTHGAIPWRLPSDFAFFKRTTMGKPLIMGRKTFDSIGKPLPGRTNIILTRQPGYRPDGVLVVGELATALERAVEIAAGAGVDEVMIGGGAELYREAMPLADRLYVTHVELSPEGDAIFPPIDPGIWAIEAEPDVPGSERDNAEFRVRIYKRRGRTAR
jgi:dihydrofolate reductase